MPSKINHVLFAALLCLLANCPHTIFASATPTTAPKAILTRIDLGTASIISSEGSVYTAYVWDVQPDEARPLFFRLKLEGEDGSDIPAAICGYSKPYTVIFVAGMTDTDGKLKLALQCLQVGTQPNPNPNPNPNPGPQPSTELGKSVKQWAETLVEGKNVKGEAGAIAANITTVVTGIMECRKPVTNRPCYPTISAARTRLQQLNIASLSSRKLAWGKWQNKLSEALEARENAGKLRTVFDFAAALREVREGLECVR